MILHFFLFMMPITGKKSSGLIRKFSDDLRDVKPADSLARGLGAKVALDRYQEKHLNRKWDVWLADGQEVVGILASEDNVLLLDQSRRLYAAWAKFKQSLPQDKQAAIDEEKGPDIKYLVKTVSTASSTWQEDRERSKTGRLKERFFKLCDNCNNHSTLLSVIPENDRYLSLLTGSLSAIAAASINHQHIAEGVVDGLDELSKTIDFWNRQMKEYGDITKLHAYIKELYVVVFEYFTEIFTRWSKSGWKRFLTSFDESAFTKLFTERKNRIKAIEGRMKDEIYFDFQHKTSKALQQIAASLDELRACGLQQPINPQQSQQRIFLLGGSIQKFIEEQFQSAVHLNDPTATTLVLDPGSSSPLLLAAEPDTIPEDDLAPIAVHHYNKTELTSAVSEYTNRVREELGELGKMLSNASYLQIERHVHQQLQLWLLGSTNLWVEGPHGVAIPSQNSLTAVSIVALSHENHVPTICYFCSLGDNKCKRDALRAMLTSIIAQLVIFLPEQGSTSTELSLTRLSSAVEEAPSIDGLLRLICDLRKAGPQYLQFVIDNIQMLEDRLDPALTRDLLMTIATFCDLAYDGTPQNDQENDDNNEIWKGSTNVTKTCFFTDGAMDGLAQAAEIDLLERIQFGAESGERVDEESVPMRF